jgi:hypothetical protein
MGMTSEVALFPKPRTASKAVWVDYGAFVNARLDVDALFPVNGLRPGMVVVVVLYDPPLFNNARRRGVRFSCRRRVVLSLARGFEVCR